MTATSADLAAAAFGNDLVRTRFGYNLPFDPLIAADRIAARCAMLLDATSPATTPSAWPDPWDIAGLPGSGADITAAHDHTLDLLIRWLDLRLPTHLSWRPAAVTAGETPACGAYPAQVHTDQLDRILDVRFTAGTAEAVAADLRTGQAGDPIGWRRDSDGLLHPIGGRWQRYTGGQRRRVLTTQPADPDLRAQDDRSLARRMDKLEDTAIADAAEALRTFLLAHPATSPAGARTRQQIRDGDPAVLDTLSPLRADTDPTGHVARRWNSHRDEPGLRFADLDPVQSADAVRLYITTYTETVMNLGLALTATSRHGATG